LFYETFGLHSKVAAVTCIFMDERHGALLARARCDAALYPVYFGQTCSLIHMI